MALLCPLILIKVSFALQELGRQVIGSCSLCCNIRLNLLLEVVTLTVHAARSGRTSCDFLFLVDLLGSLLLKILLAVVILLWTGIFFSFGLLYFLRENVADSESTSVAELVELVSRGVMLNVLSAEEMQSQHLTESISI